MRKAYEIIEHPADVGFIAYGATREELFQNAAAAMLSLACDPGNIAEREKREIEATGGDDEALLYSWLADLLAVMDAEQLFFHRVDVTELTAERVRGMAYGERYDKTRHRAGTYIKAVTFHQLRVERTAEGWKARVFLDV